MAFKIVLSFAILAVVAAVEYHHQPEYHHGPSYGGVKHDEYADAPAEYDFSYAVHDEHTGDVKSQHETRKGDVVHGSYEFIEADGHKRTVEYTADDHNGFNAVVHREPTNIKVPQPAPASYHHSAPSASYHHSAPSASYHHSAPVATYQHSAPVASYQHSAPVASYHHSAPVAQYHHSAPVAQYHHSAPVTKYVAAGPAKVYSHEPAHVSYSAPNHDYHY